VWSDRRVHSQNRHRCCYCPFEPGRRLWENRAYGDSRFGNPYADGYAHADGDPDANRDPDANGYAHANRDRDPDPDRDPNTHTDSHAHGLAGVDL
jgi:hypothetical protein